LGQSGFDVLVHLDQKSQCLRNIAQSQAFDDFGDYQERLELQLIQRIGPSYQDIFSIVRETQIQLEISE
jgi:hypothetical protein